MLIFQITVFSALLGIRGAQALERNDSPLPLRGASLSTGVDAAARARCKFDGTIVLGLPVTLDQRSKFYEMGQVQVAAQTILLDYVNEQRCGVKIANKTYAIEANYYDDHSDADYVKAIAETLVDPMTGIDLILAGYSSSLTEHISSVAHETGKLLIASGASLSSVFKDRKLTFGTLPPSALFFKSGLEAVVSQGANTVMTITEESSALLAMCGAVPQLAANMGMEFLGDHSVGPTPNYTMYEPIAQAAARLDPDVVVTCTYDCVDWVQAMRVVRWSPKAVLMTICIGSDQFVDDLGSDVSYMMGPSVWHPTTTSTDALTGWSGTEFVSRFKLESSHEQLTYHAASFMTSLSILIQSVEGASTIENAKVAEFIAENTFTTVMGELAFDENGQNVNAPFVIQHDAKGDVQTVYPSAYSSGDLLYPMPSWDSRDCLELSVCADNGSCGTDGVCVCDVGTEFRRSIGTGATAWCAREENMNFISWRLKAIGYGLFCFLMILTVLAAGWTWTNRSTWIVKASQPEQLAILILGCMVSGISILFMGAETEYRQAIDASSLPIEIANTEVWNVDRSCMAVPWLYGIGFVLSFSSLFAKIERVRLISKAVSQNKSDIKIGLSKVVHIIFLMLFVELTILLSWQVSSPLQWERSFLQEQNGIATESVGYCSSDHGSKFVSVLLTFHILSLLYALILCSKTQHLDDDFAESSSVSLSVGSLFQVMVLAIPIAIIVGDSNGVLYIVQVFTVVLQNASILLTIFVPKAIRLLRHKDRPDHLGNAKEKIPMGALTHSKWDKGVDSIDEILEAGFAMTAEQKQSMQEVKSLLLFRGSHGKRKSDEKLSYIPTALLGRRQENFLVEEFGGLNLRAEQPEYFHPPSNKNIANDAFYAPAEFHNLSLEKKLHLLDMLSLSSIGKWGFDIFKLADITGGNPLIFIGWAIMGSPHAQETMARACMKPMDRMTDFKGYNFSCSTSSIGISIETLCNYIRVVEENYSDNPYHNATHAADVLQSLHSLIQMVQVIKPSSEDVFCILLAALIHDVKHPGRNNTFQKNALTGYTLTFSDTSTLENFHVAHAMGLMLDVDVFSLGARPLAGVKAAQTATSSTNVLKNMNSEQFNAFRAKLSEAILSTDMSKHFQTTSNMKNLIELLIDQCDRANPDETDTESWEILVFLLHMADISGQAKPSQLASIWTKCIMDECFSQGDEEKKMNLPISPLCDRNTVQVMESQVNYIKFVVRPAFEVLANLSPIVNSLVLPHVDTNLNRYAGLITKPEQWSEQVSI